MDTEEFIAGLERSIAKLEKRKKEDFGRYVMVNDDYVQVEEGKGLNGTNVFVRSAPSSCRVVSFGDINEAIRSADYYLKNGAGKPILLHPEEAEKFFSAEIKKAKELVKFVQRELGAK